MHAILQRLITTAGCLLLCLGFVARAQTTITVEYIHTDALGSPVAVTNEAGQVIERTQWEPYGAAIGKPAYDGPGYTGHVMDGATGLTYMQQRYYDPGIGRFLSVDPVTAHSGTGANFNRYWYANNNPYRFTDPDGRAPSKREEEPTTGSHIKGSEVARAMLSNGGKAPKPIDPSRRTANSSSSMSGARDPLYCAGGADCDFMYNQNQFLDGKISSDDFLDRTQAQGVAGTIGGVVGGTAWASPALAVGLGRALGPSGRILGHPAYGGRTLNSLKSGKYRFGWGRDGGPVLRIGIKNKHIDLMRQQVPRQ